MAGLRPLDKVPEFRTLLRDLLWSTVLWSTVRVHVRNSVESFSLCASSLSRRFVNMKIRE
jgi:hypothetical protein